MTVRAEISAATNCVAPQVRKDDMAGPGEKESIGKIESLMRITKWILNYMTLQFEVFDRTSCANTETISAEIIEAEGGKAMQGMGRPMRQKNHHILARAKSEGEKMYVPPQIAEVRLKVVGYIIKGTIYHEWFTKGETTKVDGLKFGSTEDRETGS